MNTSMMPEEVVVFNRHIRLLLDAGVPIAIGSLLNPNDVLQFLNGVDVRASASTDTSTILEAKDIEPCYRQSLTKWLETGGGAEAFQSFNDMGIAQRKSQWSIAGSILPSLVLCSVLLPASYFMLFHIYPDIERLYAISEVQPERPMQHLLSMGSLSRGPIVGGMLLLLLIAVWLYMQVPNAIVKVFPGFRRYANVLLRTEAMVERPWPSQVSRSLSELAWKNRLQHEDNRTVRWFPLLVSTLVCGCIVAFYAILMFWPLAHLMERLSTQSGVYS